MIAPSLPSSSDSAPQIGGFSSGVGLDLHRYARDAEWVAEA